MNGGKKRGDKRERALAAALKLVLDDWANANSIGDDARRRAETALNMPTRSVERKIDPRYEGDDPAARYCARNALGGPAKVFEAMAARIRAGEEYYSVLDDYGFQVKPELAPSSPEGTRYETPLSLREAMDSATLPRYLVYDIDKHQSSPRFTDHPSKHNGESDNLDVLVDLHTGRRKYEGEWADIECVQADHQRPGGARAD